MASRLTAAAAKAFAGGHDIPPPHIPAQIVAVRLSPPHLPLLASTGPGVIIGPRGLSPGPTVRQNF